MARRDGEPARPGAAPPKPAARPTPRSAAKAAGKAVAGAPAPGPAPVPAPAGADPERLRAEGLAAQRRGELGLAVERYRDYLALRPDEAGIWSNLGVAYRRAGRFALAVGCYRRALDLQPGDGSFLGNLGNALKDLGRLDEAVATHRRAVAARPQDAGSWHNLGIALREAGRFAESLQALERALQLDPKARRIDWDRAISLLQLGRFEEGWKAYEARWLLGELPDRRPELPRWRGEDPLGTRLLVLPEQGFGDTLLALRFLPRLRELGAEVWLECKAELWRLLQGAPFVDRLVRVDEPALEPRWRVSMMSLPGLLEVDDGARLPPPPPLTVPRAAEAKVERLLKPFAGRVTVGIVWSGSVTFKNNRNRAVPLERFYELAEVPGVQLVSLQKGEPEQQLKRQRAEPLVFDLAPHLADFADTAAACRQLDLVIMTDSAVAHLAGSLGTPVWNLLNFVPYWPYRGQAATTPWYPSMRLFRQPAPGAWDEVFRQAKAALAEFAEHKRLEKAGGQRPEV